MSNVQVDDRDPGTEYIGPWGLAGALQEYLGTTHSIKANGSSFSYTFHGTSVSIFGTVPIIGNSFNMTAITSYAVDELDPVNVASLITHTTLYNYKFYTSPLLANEQHTITLTTVSVDSNAEFFFDYLEFVQLPNATTALSSSTLTSLLTSSSALSMTPGAQSLPFTTPQSAPTPVSKAVQQKSTNELSVILPAVIVPVVLVSFVLAALIYCLRQRPRKPTRLSSHNSEYASVDAFTEYPTRPFPQRRKSYITSFTDTRERHSPIDTEDRDTPRPQTDVVIEPRVRQKSSPRPVGSDMPAASSNSEWRPRDLEVHPGAGLSFTASTTTGSSSRRHVDGGVSLAGGPVDVGEELPPEYGRY